MDANDLKTPGWRYNYWELKGVPVRVEVGPKDVAANACVTARRDQGAWGGARGQGGDVRGCMACFHLLPVRAPCMPCLQ